jgi:hypothetical protein
MCATPAFLMRPVAQSTWDSYTQILNREERHEALSLLRSDSRDLIRLEQENPFLTEPLRPDIVPFVSILSRAVRGSTDIRFTIPPGGLWFVQAIVWKNRFVLGVYRRHMKTIGYLGQIGKVLGVPATTRNWNTILTVLRILKGGENKAADNTRPGAVSR